MLMTAVAEFVGVDENIEHVRAQLLADVASSLRLLESAAGHVEALRLVDHGFRDCQGADVAAHLAEAMRSSRAAYAVTHSIADRERP